MKVSLKKWCIALSVLPTLFACDSFDDRELWNAVNSLDGRVTAIEKQLETMNNDVYSLSVMIAALRDNVYVTEVVRAPEEAMSYACLTVPKLSLLMERMERMEKMVRTDRMPRC